MEIPQEQIEALTEVITDLVKAENGLKQGKSVIPPTGPPEEGQAVMIDPFTLLETLGYRERYSPITYVTLLQLSYQVPVFPGILQTRLNQLSVFGKPQPDENQTGYRIRLRDKKETASKKDQIRMEELEETIQYTGQRDCLSQDSFVTFLRKFGRDSLIFDQGCFETRCTRRKDSKRVPIDFYAIDGGSIRIADTEWKDDPKERDKQVKYVQIIDESVVAEFTPEQLCFGVRNPRTDIRVNGYGMSELEIGVQLATSLIFGFSYNSKYFTQGTVAKGMLNVPDVPQKKLNAFAQQWHMIVSGIINAWKTPITNFKDAKWIDLYKSNRDMEFGSWMDWLIKVFCSICGIDPTEINFTYGNEGQTSQMFAAPAETKVKHSKDKGLVPLLDFIADCLNRWYIWRIDPRYCFEFTGLNPREAGQIVDVEKKQVSYLKKVGELRTENDLEPAKDEIGKELDNLILDPTYLQAWQTLRQEKQQQEMMEQQQPGEGGWNEAQGSMNQEEEEPDGDLGDMKDEHWEGMMNDVAAKSLRKAVVTETKTPDTVTYEIELD